jgi:hypothetical protein
MVGGRAGRARSVVDKSWGEAAGSGFKVRTNQSPDERAAGRAQARAARATEKVDGLAARLDARAAARDAVAREREEARQSRREAEAALAASDPHKAAAQRRRGSGRKDIVREQRDTSGYTMVVDADRIRTLAKRGATVAGLAAAFSRSVEEIEQMLAGAG